MSWHMLLRDGHTRVTEKVTSEKRPEAGDIFCGKHRKKNRAWGEQKQERLRE